MEIKFDSSELRECPLCGCKVELHPDLRIMRPDQNLCADAWRLMSRMEVKCPRCWLTLDVACIDNFGTYDECVEQHKKHYDAVVKRWNKRWNEGEEDNGTDTQE